MTHARLPHTPVVERMDWLIAMLYADGQIVKEIASQIDRTESCVKDHLRNIKQDFIHAGRPCYTRIDVRLCMIRSGHMREVTRG